MERWNEMETSGKRRDLKEELVAKRIGEMEGRMKERREGRKYIEQELQQIFE